MSTVAALGTRQANPMFVQQTDNDGEAFFFQVRKFGIRISYHLPHLQRKLVELRERGRNIVDKLPECRTMSDSVSLWPVRSVATYLLYCIVTRITLAYRGKTARRAGAPSYLRQFSHCRCVLVEPHWTQPDQITVAAETDNKRTKAGNRPEMTNSAAVTISQSVSSGRTRGRRLRPAQ